MRARKSESEAGGLLADKCLEHIRSLIASGQLGEGERVNEAEIAQRLGVSRGPVREAIRRLSASGLLVPETNFGTRVAQLETHSVISLFEVRESLESMCAGLAADRMTLRERRKLARILDEHESTMSERNADAYPSGPDDWDFHLAILTGARNEFAWRICGQEFRDLFSLLRARHGRNAARGRRALVEHRWIAEAVIAGNADLAALLMRQHIRSSRSNLLATMKASDNGGGDMKGEGDDLA